MQLLLARVGAGKTIAVQDRLLELKARQPLAKVWVLLSTERQIVDFRQRFMGGAAAGKSPSTSNTSTFTACIITCWRLAAGHSAVWMIPPAMA